MKDPNNYKYITSIKCMGDGEDVIPNMLIFNRKQYLEKYFKENNLEDNICLAISDSDYSNDEIKVQWLKHFDKCIQKK